MKIDLTKQVTGKNKEAIKDSQGSTFTIRECLLVSLMNPSLSGSSVEEAILIRRLFDRIDQAEKEVELKAEEIVKIKDLCAKGLVPIVAGFVILELDPSA